MAARSKCTPETIAAICAALRAHMPLSAACVEAGITDRTYRNWREEAAGGDEDAQAAVAKIEEARMALLRSLYADVATLAKSGTKADGVKLNALKHLIAHLFPDHDPARKIELTGAAGGPIQHAHDVSADDLCDAINALAAEFAPGAGSGDPPGRGGADGAGGAGEGPR